MVKQKTKNPGGAITAGFTAAAVTLTVATGGAALLAASAIGATGAVTGNLLGSKSDITIFLMASLDQ